MPKERNGSLGDPGRIETTPTRYNFFFFFLADHGHGGRRPPPARPVRPGRWAGFEGPRLEVDSECVSLRWAVRQAGDASFGGRSDLSMYIYLFHVDTWIPKAQPEKSASKTIIIIQITWAFFFSIVENAKMSNSYLRMVFQ